MKLKKEVVEKIQKDRRLKMAIRDYFVCTDQKIYKMLRKNDQRLTIYDVLLIIAAYLQQPLQDILEDGVGYIDQVHALYGPDAHPNPAINPFK